MSVRVTGFINLFHATTLFISPETITKPQVIWCFQGVQKEVSAMKWVIVETRSHLIHFTKMWKVAWEYCFCSNIYYVRHRGVVVNLAHMHSSILGLMLASVMTALWWLELLAMGRLKIRPPIPSLFLIKLQTWPATLLKKRL